MGTAIAIILIVLAVLLIGGFIFMWVFCMKIAKKQYRNRREADGSRAC